jgi:RNA polymerase sigma factor (sigma-70 family)
MTSSTLAGLIDGHAAALRLYARQWTAAPDDAVQQAFCKLVTIAAPDDPVAWLYRAVRNAAIDAGRGDRRRRTREEQSARPEGWFDHSLADGLDAATAVAALESLPGEQREVIVARLWGGLTFEQIAAAHGSSVSSAYRRFEAGIAALRVHLGEPCPTSSNH